LFVRGANLQHLQQNHVNFDTEIAAFEQVVVPI
jgi:hypothetical protein